MRDESYKVCFTADHGVPVSTRVLLVDLGEIRMRDRRSGSFGARLLPRQAPARQVLSGVRLRSDDSMTIREFEKCYKFRKTLREKRGTVCSISLCGIC